MLPQLHAGRLRHRERVAVVEDAAAHPVREHRCLQPLRDLAQRVARVSGAAAGDDERAFGRHEEPRRVLDRPGVGGDRRRDGRRFDALDVRLQPEHVHRRFDRDRTRHPGAQCIECGAHPRRGLGRVLDARGPLGEPAQQGELIGELVQQPVPLADGMGGDLSGDREHRGAGGVGGGERCGGVQDPRPRHHRAGADPRACLGIAEGHVRGGLLVAGVDHPDAVALVVQRVEQGVELDAGKPEHGVHPVRDEGAHDGARGRHPLHLVLRGRGAAMPAMWSMPVRGKARGPCRPAVRPRPRGPRGESGPRPARPPPR